MIADGAPIHGALICAVAAHGLPGTSLIFPDEPLSDNTWTELLSTVCLQRITGLLVLTITDGTLAATDEQLDAASTAHLDAVGLTLRLERLLIDVVRSMDEAEIDHRVLKGPALARLLYANPSMRTYGDIDVLVPTAAFDAAVGLLGRAGYHRRYPEPRPGFDRRFTKGASFTTNDGLEVDLHRTLVNGPFGLRVHLDDLFDGYAPFEISGVVMRALAPEVRLLNLCYHAALGDVPPRLQPLRDVAESVLVQGVDEERVLFLSRKWRGEAAVGRGISLAYDLLGLPAVGELVEWAKYFHPTRLDVRALEAYGRGWTYEALAAVRAVPGVAAKLAYLRALAVPDQQFLYGRGQNRILRWKRVARQLRRSSRHD